jgi:hypothetical protein
VSATERPCCSGPATLRVDGPPCGQLATVVCTARERAIPSLRFAMDLTKDMEPTQWFACDDPKHQGGVKTEPIEAYFDRLARKGAVALLSGLHPEEKRKNKRR